MSHSKGFLRGTCPGSFKKSGRPRDGQQTLKCGRCGALKQKRVRKCFLFHDYQNSGKVDHGFQKQKCTRCGDSRKAQVFNCGFLRTHSYHRCDKAPATHCKRCGRELPQNVKNKIEEKIEEHM